MVQIRRFHSGTHRNPISKAIDPPKLDAIETAWKTLLDLGAVESEDPASRLTALGRHVSNIGNGLWRCADVSVDEYDSCGFTVGKDARVGNDIQMSRFGQVQISNNANDKILQDDGSLRFVVLTIAAVLSAKPLFTSPMEKRDESKK